MPASFLFALAVVATSPEAPATVIPAFDKDPTVMTQSEIRAFNLGRDKKDPNFIRCKRFEETGSLIKRTLTCHTNAQWEKEFLEGNQNARDTVDRMTPKLINGHE
jgi:hypothetical protein